MLRRKMQRVQEQAQTSTNKHKQAQTSTNKHEVYYSNFINSLPADATKKDYGMTIRDFMRFLGIPEGNYGDLVVAKDKTAIEIDIKSYLVYLRKRGVTYGSANHYLSAIKAFYYENSDFEFKWKRIKKHLGEDTGPAKKKGEDRGYRLEEIQTMIENARDPRTKIAILLMASNGMRVGVLPDLVIGDLTKIPEHEDVYEIKVYNEYKQAYTTFCSRECTKEIDAYLQYRKNCGEELKATSPLIREQFDSRDGFKARNPQKIKRATICYLINQVLTKHTPLKPKLAYDKEKRRVIGLHQTAMTHAFRKFFTSTAVNEGGMLPDWADLLTGHKMPGVRNSYLIPTPKQLLEGTAERKEGYLRRTLANNKQRGEGKACKKEA